MEIQSWTLPVTALLIATTILVLWLLDDTKSPPTVLGIDEKLWPKTPKPDHHQSPIQVARTILEAFVSQSRRTLGAADAAALSPIQVTHAYLPEWMSGTIPLKHPVNGWTIDYDGGGSATATSRDGVRIQLDATLRRRSPSKTMICAVVLGTGEIQLIDVPARTTTATNHYKTLGWGRLRRYMAAPADAVNAKTITKYFQYLDTQVR